MVSLAELSLNYSVYNLESNAEAKRALLLEGRNPEFDIHEYFSSLRDEAEDHDWASVISEFSRGMALPLDKIACALTDASFYSLTTLRKSGFSKNLQPWEKWYVEQGGELKEINEKDAAISWLADALFPKDILQGVDYLRPGIGTEWENTFRGLAQEMLYAPMRETIDNMSSSVIDGVSTVSLKSFVGIGLSKAALSPISSALDIQAGVWRNRMYGYYDALKADLRLAFKEYGKEAFVPTAVDQILTGFSEKYDYALSRINLWVRWTGLSAGVTIASIAKDGPYSGFLYGAGASAVTLSGIIGLNKLLTEYIHPKVVREFGDIQKTIIEMTARSAKWSDVSSTSSATGEIHALATERARITSKKNIANNTVTGSVPDGLTLLLYSLGANSYTGAAYLVSKSLSAVFAHTGSLMGYQSRLRSRDKAIEKFRITLAELKNERGPLADDMLGKWQTQAKNSEALFKPSLSVTLKRVGVPEYKRKGEIIRQINFSDDFQLNGGDVVFLGGGNESGKTTLIKTIVGIYSGRPSDTEIFWNGEDIRSMTVSDRRHRFLFVGKETDHFDLRSVTTKILLYYKNSLLQIDYDEQRLKKWVHGSEDIELEDSILEYFRVNNILPEINASWFRDGFIPSGFQQSMILTGLYLSIREPVVLFIDEAGGTMTDENFKSLASFIEQGVTSFPGILFISANKGHRHFIELPTTKAIINMYNSIQGQMKNSSETSEQFQKERIHELNELFAHGVRMTPKDYYYWLQYGPRKKAVEKIRRKIRRNQVDMSSKHSYRTESGIYDWEHDEKMSKYLEDNLLTWLEQGFNKESLVKNMYEATRILHILNYFYGIASEVTSEYHSRNLEWKIGQGWSPKLHRVFIDAYSPLIARANEEFKDLDPDQLTSFSAAHFIQFAAFENAYRNFHYQHIDHEKNFMNPTYPQFEKYGLFDSWSYATSVLEMRGFKAILDDSISLFAFAIDENPYWLNKLVESCLFSIREADDQLLTLISTKLKEKKWLDYKGNIWSVWDKINSNNLIQHAITKRRMSLIATQV